MHPEIGSILKGDGEKLFQEVYGPLSCYSLQSRDSRRVSSKEVNGGWPPYR
jgi:hypothetical protein